MTDLISRAAAIAWFFRPYSNEEYYSNLDVERALKAISTVDAVPIADAKAIADIALYAISKMEDFGCAYVWEKSGDPYADENNIRGECQYYRRKIKDIKERWHCEDLCYA